MEGVTVIIDCDSCTARGPACDDCVVSVMLGPTFGVEIDDAERRALQALAEGGLVPQLRLSVAGGGPAGTSDAAAGRSRGAAARRSRRVG